VKKLLTPKMVEQDYDLKEGYLAKLRCGYGEDEGPVFVKIGRKVFYEPAAIEAYIAARRRTSTSDPGA
jgi:hypothetical protein